MRATVLKAVTVVALVFATAALAQAQDTYIIIGNGAAFTAFKNDDVVGTANTAIQAAIDAIKADAGGRPCAIQFGNGRDTLSIGSANIIFDGGAGSSGWGKITLSGKLASSYGSDNKLESGAIHLKNGASIACAAEIENTALLSYVYAIYNESGREVTISGGSVSATAGYGNSSSYVHSCAIYNKTDWPLLILDGSISAASNSLNSALSSAIYNEINSEITIRGGNVSATANSRYMSSIACGVYNKSTGTVRIGGGSLTGDNGVIYNESAGELTITGGSVSATSGIGIYNNSGEVTITGGSVSSPDDAIKNVKGNVTITGGSVLETSLYTLSYTSCSSISNSTGTITIFGGRVSGVSCDSASGSLILGGSPEIGFINGFGMGKISIVEIYNNPFASTGEIYLIQLSSYLIDEIAIFGSSTYGSNIMLSTTSYRLAPSSSGNELLIKAVMTDAVYTVGFNLNGGNGIAPAAVNVLSGSRLPRLVSTTGYYYDFSGRESDGKWYTDPECTTEFVFGANGTEVTGDITLYLKWVENNGVLSSEKVIPSGNPGEVVAITPVGQFAGEFTAGPNPVDRSAGGVTFFWQGKAIASGMLYVYDASGNNIRKIVITDNTVIGSQAKRRVGSWDLKDSKGRQVGEGTYLVKGKISPVSGKSERVSVIVGVSFNLKSKK